MKTEDFSTQIRPVIPSCYELLKAKEIECSKWPANLRRFSLFKRKANGVELQFRAISWDPLTSRLYVLRVEPGVSPNACRMPECFYVASENELLEEIVHISENIKFQFMFENNDAIPLACLNGLSKKNMLINAILMLDPSGKGECESYIFNDEILTCATARTAAIQRVCKAIGKESSSYRPYLLKLLTKFLWFGGGPTALMSLTPLQGGPGVSRVGKNIKKPGRLSNLEELEVNRSKYAGNPINSRKRQRPVHPLDLKKFAIVLNEYWAKKRMSYSETYDQLILNYYKKQSKWLCPTFRMFKFHAANLIREHDLKRLRLGSILSLQHNDARVGQSSDITQGVIEVLDVDGFVAKLFVEAKVKGKSEPVPVTVLYGVSRLSGAVLGYEIALRGENAESFRRCIASAFLSKFERASGLGLSHLPGLLHGNIDAIFVDNGAGASEKVIAAACDNMNLLRYLPPPGRGDLKGVGEGLNGIM